MRIVISFDTGLGAVQMMRGYLDDIHRYLDDQGHYTELMKLEGRDHGMDLAQHYITANYQIQSARTIINQALAVIPSEITCAAGASVDIPYEFDRTFLVDGIREISEKVDYDFYVSDAMPPVLNFFAIGAAADSLVDLLSDVESVTNNILRLDIGENLGYGIKNHVEIYMGGVKDHWSDETAQPAVPPPYGLIGGEVDGNTTVTNIRAAPPPFAPLMGRSVIQWSRAGVAGASIHSMLIDFAAAAAAPWTNVSDYYGYAGGSIDLSERNDCHVMMRSDTRVDGAQWNCRPMLVDLAGNAIWFYALLGAAVPAQDDDRQGYGPTDDLVADKWYRLKFPVGDDLTVHAALTNQAWSDILGAGGFAFGWNQVIELWFTSVVNHQPGNFWIDDLTIPGVEARYVTSNAASIGSYGQRMLPVFRGDIGSQVAAVNLGENILAKRIDPLNSISITALGQTGNIYAGELVHVRAPSSGIAALTHYRIVKLHHNVALSPDRATIPGLDFITEYDLVRFQAAGPVDIPYDPYRLEENLNPRDGQLQITQRYRRALDNTKWAREK